MKNDNTTWVVFIDALDDKDLSRTEFLSNTRKGRMDAGVPRVTPDVLSKVYTGIGPEHTGIGRLHMSTDIDPPERPDEQTVMEELENGEDILVLGMPYAGPLQFSEPSMGVSGGAHGTHFTPAEQKSVLDFPGPAGDLIEGKNHQANFDYGVDYITQQFSAARTFSADYDYIFLGLRLIDGYCHFQYQTGEDGRGVETGERYRDKLAEVVDVHLKQIENRGDDIYWFSDHGAQEMEHTFYINKWLSNNGYLEYDVDWDYIERSQELGVRGESHPSEQRIQNQVTPSDASVVVDYENSDAICTDPYDGGIKALTDDDTVVREIAGKLKEEETMRDVHISDEYYDDNGQYSDDMPDIWPDRGEGVFITSSVHKNPIGMGYYRTGVHNRYGVYGNNVDVGGGDVKPKQINKHIREVVGLE